MKTTRQLNKVIIQGVKPNSLEEVTDLNLRRIIDMCLKQKAQDR